MRLIESASNLFHRAMLMTLYSTGMRRAELCHLKVEDIDSERMLIHIRQGKGNRDRDVPLSPKLLETLREYWRWMKPKTYLVPRHGERLARGQPIYAQDGLGSLPRGRAAGRHHQTRSPAPDFATVSPPTWSEQGGADLPTVQALLGHADLKPTSIYLHLSRAPPPGVGNPLDKVQTVEPGTREAVTKAGSYVPAKILTSEQVVENLPASPEWIVETLGIHERRVAEPDEYRSDLAAAAGLEAVASPSS